MLITINIDAPLRLDNETGVILLCDAPNREQAIMKIIGGVPHFYSKRLKKWVPVPGKAEK